MANLYFTSDQHFGAQRTLELSRRPYKTVEEMNEDIIRKFNSLVTKDDYCIHLGDFGDYDILKRLNGTHAIIFGNYEHEDVKKLGGDPKVLYEKLAEVGFSSVTPHHIVIRYKPDLEKRNLGDDARFTDYGVDKLYLTHKPEDCVKDNPRIFNLFGHIHGLQKVRKYGLNVGVDANHFYPVSFKDVKFYINAIKNYYDNNVFE